MDAVMDPMIGRWVAGGWESAVQSACVGFALIAVSVVARRVSAPWRAALLAIGVVRFALPPLPSPVHVELPWLPAADPRVGEGFASMAGVLFALWMAGAVFQLMRLVRARMRWSRVLSSATRNETCGDIRASRINGSRIAARAAGDEAYAVLLDQARSAAQALGIATPRVTMSCEVQAPLVVGLIRPTVIVDDGWIALDARARRLVLLHEMAHVKRGDLWWVELASWLSVAWWWHPVFRLLVARMRSAQEDACDDLAMLAAPEPDRYCRLLLETAGRAATQAPVPALAFEPLGFNGRTLERRIRRLMDPHTRHAPGVSPAQWAGMALVAALAFAAFGSHVAPQHSSSPRHMQFSIPHHSHHHGH